MGKNKWWENLGNTIGTVVNGVKDSVSNSVDTVKGWFDGNNNANNAVNNVKNNLSNAVNEAKNSVNNVVNKIKDGVSNSVDTVRGWFDSDNNNTSNKPITENKTQTTTPTPPQTQTPKPVFKSDGASVQEVNGGTTNSGLVNQRPSASDLDKKPTFQMIGGNGESLTNTGKVEKPEVQEQKPKEPETEKVVEEPFIEYKNSGYDDIKKELDLSKASAQNDVANANRVASQYLHNYLKQQGIQGSGLGASAVAGLGANYATNMANVNKNYNDSLSDYKKTYNENLLSEDSLKMLRGMSNENAKSYLDSMAKDSGVTTDTLNKLMGYNSIYTNERNQEFKDNKTDMLGTLDELINSGQLSGEELAGFKEVFKEYQNAETPEDLEKAEETLNSIMYPTMDDLPVKNEDGSINASKASVLDFGDYAGLKDPDSKQCKYINAILKAVNVGDIKDGTYIDMNWGAGSKDVYLYENGVFKKVDKSSINYQTLKNHGKLITNESNTDSWKKYYE